MSMTSASALHAALGMGFAVPLMATSLIGRHQRMRRNFPVLEALHDCQEKAMQPMVLGLDLPQLLIICITCTLPLVTFMLPAMHGCVLLLGVLLQREVLAPAGLYISGPISAELAVLLPAMTSSYLSAFLVARQLAVKRGQYQVLHSAITHSDRYFRLTESMSLQTGDTAQQSRRVSKAFKTVSMVWVVMRKKVSQLAFVLTGFNICYIALVWHVTDDLSTPLACAALSLGCEMLLCRRSLAAKEAARKLLRQELDARHKKSDE